MLRLIVLAALLGCVQSYKSLASYPSSGDQLAAPVPSSYYVAPLYLSRGGDYQYQPSTYKQVEIAKYSAPLQTFRNPLTSTLHQGRLPYQPVPVPVPPYNPYTPYTPYTPYNPYNPYNPYTPYASEGSPLAYLVVRPPTPSADTPLHYSTGTKGGLSQSAIKGAAETPRVQQETKGTSESLQQEIKEAPEPTILQQETKGAPEPARIQQETKSAPEPIRTQQEIKGQEPGRELPQQLEQAPEAPAQPQPEPASALNQLEASKQSKLAKLKSSVNRLAALAKSKITLGSTYHVAAEEYLQAPQMPALQQYEEAPQQQEEPVQQERDLQQTSADASYEQTKGYSQRQTPLQASSF